MDIKKTFLNLTDQLYPHPRVGTEAQKVKEFDESAQKIYKILKENVPGIKRDDYGNFYFRIQNDKPTTVMFTSHLDTATQAKGKVTHKFDGDMIKTDGTTILGADDKAGVVIMFHMIKNKVPGLYYFFLAEEVGCLGSKWLGRKLEDEKWIEKDLYKNINKVISFDRKGYDSVISYQNYRSASDKFTDELAKRLNKADKTETFKYKTDPTGMYTDSARISHIYPECTNLSVGYFSQHTKSEKQNLAFLTKLCDAVIRVDWETLPVERDPKKDNESKHYRGSSSYDSWGNDYGYGGGTSYNHKRNNNSYGKTKKKEEISIEYLQDDKYSEIIEIKTKGSEVADIKMCKHRIEYEARLIRELLQIMDIKYSEIEWDGINLDIKDKNRKSNMNRSEIIEFLPELDYQSNVA